MYQKHVSTYQMCVLRTVKPTSLKVNGPLEPVVAGEMVSLTCTVHGARPPATIDWFNRSDLIEPQPNSVEEVSHDSTFRYDHLSSSSCLSFLSSPSSSVHGKDADSFIVPIVSLLVVGFCHKNGERIRTCIERETSS